MCWPMDLGSQRFVQLSRLSWISLEIWILGAGKDLSCDGVNCALVSYGATLARGSGVGLCGQVSVESEL